MLIISAKELMQSQKKFFEMAGSQRIIIKKKNKFFELVDLGETIPEPDDTCMSREELFAKIDEVLKNISREKEEY
jgi:hypothetical protein